MYVVGKACQKPTNKENNEGKKNLPRNVITLNLFTFLVSSEVSCCIRFLSHVSLFFLSNASEGGSRPHSTVLKADEFMDSAFPRGNEVCRPKVKGTFIHVAQVMLKHHTRSKAQLPEAQQYPD